MQDEASFMDELFAGLDSESLFGVPSSLGDEGDSRTELPGRGGGKRDKSPWRGGGKRDEGDSLRSSLGQRNEPISYNKAHLSGNKTLLPMSDQKTTLLEPGNTCKRSVAPAPKRPPTPCKKARLVHGPEQASYESLSDKAPEQTSYESLFSGIDFGDDDAGDSSRESVQVTGLPNGGQMHVPASKRFIRAVVTACDEDAAFSKRLTVVPNEGSWGLSHLSESSLHPSEILSQPHPPSTLQIHLSDEWAQLCINEGDTVNIITDAPGPSITVSRKEGALIMHPDILVPSTKVAESANCLRKAILTHIIKDSSVSAGSKPMLYGNMIHELMQLCMTTLKWDNRAISLFSERILRAYAQSLWSLQLSADEARAELKERSSLLQAFFDMYMASKPKSAATVENVRQKPNQKTVLAITNVMEIEEDIWSPKYGLKGKVDVSISGIVDTIETKLPGLRAPSNTKRVYPLEIKTGKAVAAMEHRAQTMLYTLLMGDRYDTSIDSGFLYYSKQSQTITVDALPNEVRALLIARNEFAIFLHRRMHLTSDKDLDDSEESQDVAVDSYYQADAPSVSQYANPEVRPKPLPLLYTQGALDAGEPLLPPPIDDKFACKYCYVRSECMLIRKANEGAQHISTDTSDPLEKLYFELTQSLAPHHYSFFTHWERLISLEEQDLLKFKKEIWYLNAQERVKVGRCIADLVVDRSFEADVHADARLASQDRIRRFTYRLVVAPGKSLAEKSFLGGSISVNDAIVVSLEEPQVLSVARGFVSEVGADFVIISVDHSLVDIPQLKWQSRKGLPVFRLDKDEMTGGLGRIRDNVFKLFVSDEPEMLKLRRMVVDLDTPRFEPVRPLLDGEKSIGGINKDQTRAIEKVLSAKDYALILGMPGTGKTTTIVELVKRLVKEGKTVLLTSYTHSSLDTILQKLVSDPQFSDAPSESILRLGNPDRVAPALKALTLESDGESDERSESQKGGVENGSKDANGVEGAGAKKSRTPNDKTETPSERLDRRLLKPPVVATTCLSIGHVVFSQRRFDVCIVDEASQVTLPTCLGPLRYADTFVLVGDHNQLPPLVRNRHAKREGLDVSLFKLLSDAHPEAVACLVHQYRMNADIQVLANELIYGGRLVVGSDEVASRRLRMDTNANGPSLVAAATADRLSHVNEAGVDLDWLPAVSSPNRPVVFVDTDALPARETRRAGMVENAGECEIAARLAAHLVDCGVPESSIGVITLYRQQIKLLSHRMRPLSGIEILTADQSQGRDKECVILSMVRSNDSHKTGDLLKDWRRLNVCLTRAKSKLIIIGSKSTLSSLDLLKRFVDVVENRSWIYTLPANALPASDLRLSPRKQKNWDSAVNGTEKLVDGLLQQPVLRDIQNESL